MGATSSRAITSASHNDFDVRVLGKDPAYKILVFYNSEDNSHKAAHKFHNTIEEPNYHQSPSGYLPTIIEDISKDPTRIYLKNRVIMFSHPEAMDYSLFKSHFEQEISGLILLILSKKNLQKSIDNEAIKGVINGNNKVNILIWHDSIPDQDIRKLLPENFEGNVYISDDLKRDPKEVVLFVQENFREKPGFRAYEFSCYNESTGTSIRLTAEQTLFSPKNSNSVLESEYRVTQETSRGAVVTSASMLQSQPRK